MTNTQTLGQFIQQRRQDLNLTQEALAERLGDSVRQSDVSRLERDRINLPRRERLEQLAAALEVSLGDLLAHTGWLTTGDHLDQGLNRKMVTGATSVEAIERPTPDQVTALMTVIKDTQALIALTQEALTAADAALHLTVSTLSRSSERGRVHPPAGLVDQWETAAVIP